MREIRLVLAIIMRLLCICIHNNIIVDINFFIMR